MLRKTLLAIASITVLVACSDAAGPSPDDSEALLTDAQLTTERDPAEVPVDPAWANWISENHYVIRSLTSHKTSDLQFLKNVIGSRRLVQLGESGHGVREFDMAKVRLIRFLHEEMGFDVIAFESPQYECYRANQLMDVDPPNITMGRCALSVWHTDEVLELFKYLDETRSTSRPLILAGFDTQFTSIGQQFSADVLYDVLSRIDTAFATRIRDMDHVFRSEYETAIAANPLNPVGTATAIEAADANYRFSARYDSAKAMIESNSATLKTAFAASPETPIIAAQIIVLRLERMTSARTRTTFAGLEARDRGMADNIDFLLDKLYPGKKIIAWAHNAHVMHDRRSMDMVDADALYPQSMGSYVSARHRADLYSVGLFMYRGQAADNGRTIYPIQRALPGSLEAVMYHTRKQWTFVDMLSQSRNTGNAWMFNPIPIKEWGKNDYRFTPRNQFDGILFIDTVNPPAYYVPKSPRG